MKAKRTIESLKENEQIKCENKKQLRGIAELLDFGNVFTKVPCFVVKTGSGHKISKTADGTLPISPAKDFMPAKPKFKKEVFQQLASFDSRISDLEKTQVIFEPDFENVELKELPEKWCVRRKKNNADVINKWANSQPNTLRDFFKETHHLYFYQDGAGSSMPSGYTEISFADFKRLVLKEGDSKKQLGKWYKDPNSKALLFFEDCNGMDDIGYGFDIEGEWMESGCLDFDGLIPATEEVKAALIAEAEKRGFKEGVRFIGIEGAEKYDRIPIKEIKYSNEDSYVGLYSGNSWILLKGKWAEVISEQEEEKEIDFSIPGQLLSSHNMVVLTTGKLLGNDFYAIKISNIDNGNSLNIGDYELFLKLHFKLYTGEITLKNK